MTNFCTLRDKYMRDATFRLIVDQMVNLLNSFELSPGEMREAAMLAEIKFRQSYHVSELFPET